MVFSFKLDQNSLPKLSAHGENFSEWQSAWQLALEFADLEGIITGKLLKPEPNSPDFPEWKMKNTKARVMLMAAVHNDLTILVSTAKTAAEAWSNLSGRFDRDTGNNSVYLFRSLTNLRYRDGEDLRAHTDEFHQLWIRLHNRCSNSRQAVARTMKPLFESDEVKGSFFLTTLPDTMDYIIDNFNTRDVTSFSQIQPRIMDMADQHNLKAVESTAYAASRKFPAKGAAKTSKPQAKSSASSPATRECSWCKKRNFTFVGHLYTDCDRLRRSQNHQQHQPSSSSSGSGKREAQAAIALDDDDDEVITAFSAHTTGPRAVRRRLPLTDLGAAKGPCVTAAFPDVTSGPYSSLKADDPAMTRNPSGSESHSLSRQSAVTKQPSSQPVSAYAADLEPAAISSTPTAWILDSGASRHMTGSVDDFSDLRPQTGTISIAGGLKLPIQGQGTVRLRCLLQDGSTCIAELTNVLYSSELRGTRLFSWPYVRHQGELHGKGNHMAIHVNGRQVLWAKHIRGSLEIQVDNDASGNFASYREFHCAIGHFNVKPTRLYTPEDVELIPNKPANFQCEQCDMSKSVHHKPHSIASRNVKPFDCIHSDLSGKFSQRSLGGSWYYISFIDEATRFAWTRFLASKADAPRVVLQFLAYVERQFNRKVKELRSDNGGEYIAKALSDRLADAGVEHATSAPYHHESNGLAERFNRTITTAARAMLTADSMMPLWAEAVRTATYLKNIAGHAAVLNTPYEALLHEKPSIAHLRPFGQRVYVHIPVEARKPGTKLLHRAERGYFVGYGKSRSIYRIYVPDRSAVVESKDVKFAPFSDPSQHSFELSNDEDSDDAQITAPSHPTREMSAVTTHPSSPVQRSLPETGPGTPTTPRMAGSWGSPSRIPTPTSSPRPRRYTVRRDETSTEASRSSQPPPSSQSSVTTRAGRTVIPSRKAREALGMHVHTDDDASPFEEVRAFVTQLAESDDVPANIAQARKSPDWPLWKAAIQRELDSHAANGTWKIVKDIPAKMIGCRWVFAIKVDADGNKTYKARLVAQGFSQIQGIDFEDTYAPVVRYDSLRLLIRLAILFGWDLQQVDFDTAYLNGLLSEIIFMKPPPGFEHQFQGALQLLKALYGLKQAGRQWFGTLEKWLIAQGFTAMHFDPCVFACKDLIVAVYVDDLLLAGKTAAINKFKSLLTQKFKCKDLGLARHLLGIEIDRDDHGVYLGQSQYAERVLERFGMQACNGKGSPLDAGCFPHRTPESEPVDAKRQLTYQKLIGSLNYLVTCTRPDLAFTVSMLATYNTNPGDDHLKIAQRVLRYVQATKHYRLHYLTRQNAASSAHLSMIQNCDASWGNDPDTFRSFGGYITCLEDAPISWSAKRQSCVAKSTCEAEYMACSYAASHLVWVTQAMVALSIQATYTLKSDNEGTLDIIHNNKTSVKTKHIAIHFHFVRERYMAGGYAIEHVPSKSNISDICTKSLPKPLFQQFRSRLHLRP